MLDYQIIRIVVHGTALGSLDLIPATSWRRGTALGGGGGGGGGSTVRYSIFTIVYNAA